MSRRHKEKRGDGGGDRRGQRATDPRLQVRIPVSPVRVPSTVQHDNRAYFDDYASGPESAQTYDYEQEYFEYSQRVPNYRRQVAQDGRFYEISESPSTSRDSYRARDNSIVVDHPSPIEKKRKCRDVLCLAFFMSSIVLSLGIAVYSSHYGDWRRFVNGVDLNCDICGIANTVKLGIPNSGKNLSHNIFLVTVKRRRKKRTNFRFPEEELQLPFIPSSTNLTKEPLRECRSACPPKSNIILNRCVSRSKFDFESNRSARINVEALTIDDVTDAVDDVTVLFNEIVQDFESSWKDILWIGLISLGVTIFLTILLRVFAGVIIWLLVVSISLAAIGGSTTLWLLWWFQYTAGEGQRAWTSTQVTTLLVATIVVSILTIILLILLVFMRKRICLVIQLFNEAGKAIHALPFILFQPLLTFVALGISFISAIVVAILIETSGTPVIETIETDDPTVRNCHFEKNLVILVSRWWNLFMVIWMTQFILGCQHLVIAGAITTWYFTRDKSRLTFPLALSYHRLLRYHLGSVAFGSLIIAIVKLIRYILTTIQKRLEGNNALCRALLWSFQCFLWCLEKFLKFLNGNAYIEIAIYGQGFCKSAEKAFSAITNNVLRIATIQSIGDFVLFLTKLSIVALSVVIGYEILIKNKDDLYHIWVPLTSGGILAYCVAHCFIGVYEMAIDTVFLCFYEDCEMNDGDQKPYYMTKGLMEFVKNSEKVLTQSKSRGPDQNITVNEP